MRHGRAARRVLAAAALALSGAGASSAAGQELRPRGIVRSLGEAAIASELSARILSMPFREGQAFRAGDVLVQFDCARLRAELAAAEAERAAAKATYDSNREMAQFKAIGGRDLAVSAAQLDKAAAEVEASRTRAAACSIVAPYDGFVTERLANENEMSAPSGPLLRIVDSHRLEIELIVPSRWLGWVKPGTPFTFAVEETGTTYEARVTRVGASVDPVSRTVKLFGAFEGAPAEIRHGMSGAARFAGGPT